MHATLLALLHSFAVAEAAYYSIPLVKSRIPGTYTGLKSRQSGQAPASETEVFSNTYWDQTLNADMLSSSGSATSLLAQRKMLYFF